MRNFLIFFLILSSGLVTKVFAQDCAGTARGNIFPGANGRYFIMTYDTQADRDAALVNINSITINGSTYNVGPHPTGNNSIRTTPAQPIGTFANPFTGTVTLNPSGEICEYVANILPVTLAYINAMIEKSTVIITWETIQEINNHGFEIQQSTDGRNFETFTWVDGNGSTNQTQYYEVRHTDYSQGINYYRFKQIDYDGAFEFSPIVVVNVETKNLVRLERNVLIQGQEVILLDANNGVFEIFNASGSKVSSGIIEAQSQSLPTAGFNAGMYFIRTEGGNILKFIIK